MPQFLIVNKDFLPQSVRRSWHDDFKAGERCKVLEERENGLLVDKPKMPLFVLDEEIRDYCTLEGKFSD